MSLKLDWESRGVRDLLKEGAYRYAEHKHTDALMASYKIGKGPLRRWKRGQPCPADIRAHVEAGGEIKAHNAAFERLIWWMIMVPRYGWPKPRLEQFRCTAVTAAALSLPRSLDRLGIALDLKHKKGKEGKALIKLHSMPQSFTPDGEPIWNEDPSSLEKFALYCDDDVLAEEEADDRLIPLSDYEQKVYWLNERINDRGIRLDVKSARAALVMIERAKERINEEIAELTGRVVTACTQTAAMKRWIEAQGVFMPSMDKDDVEEFLHASDLPDRVKRVLELRQEGAKPSVEKIAAMLQRTCDDGRIRGVYLDHGAGQTGRFCVDRETIVDTPDGGRRISDLRAGDHVVSHMRRAQLVTAVICKGAEEMFRLDGPAGEFIEATAAHRILTQVGWRRIDECFEETSAECFTLREGSAPVSFADQHNRRHRDGLRADAAHSRRDPGHTADGRRALPAAGRESLPEEDRRSEPDVWQAHRSGTDITQGASGRMERRGLHLRTPNDRGESSRTAGAPGSLGGAPPGRRQDEQRSGQLGDHDEARTSLPSQTDAWTLVRLGEREVWDISVTSDASYLAQGLAHHNSSRGAQLHNMPKYRKIFENAKPDLALLFEHIRSGDPRMVELMYGPELGRPLHLLSDAVRGFLWAAPGHEFIDIDYSSIESVLGAWIVGEEWKLDAYRAINRGEGIGMYELAAAAIYGIDISEVTKQHRPVGKLSELSCQYQTGVGGIKKFARQNKVLLPPLFPALWKSADEEAQEGVAKRYEERVKAHDPNTDALGREGWIAAELIKLGWRAKNPAFVAGWKLLEDAATGAVNEPGAIYEALGAKYRVAHGFLWCLLPSGRALAYGRPKIEDVVAPWADMTLAPAKRERKRGITVVGVDAVTEKWVRRPIYGGALFNNVVQGGARDILVHGMFNVEAHGGYPIVLHTHDEMAAEVPRGYGGIEEMAALANDLPAWCRDLPLKASGWRGKRYRKD